jgi:uncharacterized membrane protein YhiD involved in acid resistance
MNTFSNIFKNSFLENFSASQISTVDTAITLLITFLIGLFIFQIYKRTFQGIMYTRSFNISLVMISMVTSLVIMAVTTNIVLSLGMVGALSIVRFRTAIKDPMDIVFMFWAIAVGIVTGASFYLLAVIGSLIIGTILLVFANFKSQTSPFILMLSYSNSEAEKAITDLLKDNVKRYNVKSKTVTDQNIELSVELRIKTGEIEFVNKLKSIPGVVNAMLVSYNGDYAA